MEFPDRWGNLGSPLSPDRCPLLPMKSRLCLLLALFCCATLQTPAAAPSRHLSRTELRNKIRGAWAGQMIGVVYGAPTEFKWLGRLNDAPIPAIPFDNVIVQDDLYVEMTFARVMDTRGLDATMADYAEAFRQSRYHLWHANAGARRNLNRGLPAPLSGDPRYNLHCDDIDFQIESDFIGIMCPGLPQEANRYAERVGRIMNHGDGLYGGMFIAGMYTAAFFETDPRRVVAAGLACIPADSGYGRVIRDLLDWTADGRQDWRQIWQRLQDKWDRDDLCAEGVQRPFNIDAKINGAYLALGLLAGGGDWQRTMEIATRCGQDSDCNPSSACGVLGAILGYDGIPAAHRAAVQSLADRKFDFTDYSFNDIVASTERRALEVIRRAGGTVTDQEIILPLQTAVPPPLETSGYGRPVAVFLGDDPAWTWRGTWQTKPHEIWGEKSLQHIADGAGSEAVLRFNGTAIALVGDLSTAGGRAEVYLDGVKCDLLADAFIADDHTHDNDLWRIQGLADGPHTLRLVMTDTADSRSQGHQLALARAVAYRAP